MVTVVIERRASLHPLADLHHRQRSDDRRRRQPEAGTRRMRRMGGERGREFAIAECGWSPTPPKRQRVVGGACRCTTRLPSAFFPRLPARRLWRQWQYWLRRLYQHDRNDHTHGTKTDREQCDCLRQYTHTWGTFCSYCADQQGSPEPPPISPCIR